MKHEKIAGVADQVSPMFLRTLAICVLIGGAFWVSLLAIAL